MEMSKETEQTLKWVRREILSGAIVSSKSAEAAVWNGCLDRAVRIIDAYADGKGIFQLTNKE